MSLVPLRWTLRDILSGKRALGVLAITLVPAFLLALLAIAGTEFTPTERRQTTAGLTTTVVMPVVAGLVAIVVSGPVLRAPLQEGTILYQLTRPIPRAWLGAQRCAAAALVTAVATVASALPLGLFLGQWSLVTGALPGLLLGGLAFGALYGAITSLHRYALGVAVVHLVAETALGHVSFRIHEATLTWHVWGLLGELTTAAPGTIPAGGGTWWPPALVLVLGIAGAALLFKLRPFSLNVADA